MHVCLGMTIRAKEHSNTLSRRPLCHCNVAVQDFYASHKLQVEESKPYIEQYGSQRLPKYMQYVEDVLQYNNGDYLMGAQFTVADISVYHLLAAAQQHYRWVFTYACMQGCA